MVKSIISRVMPITGVVFALSIQPCFSAPSDSFVPGSTKLTDGTTMYYRLYVPRTYKKTIKYPIVITMHGIGECGSDNRIQVDHESIVRQWMLDSVQKKYAPFILSPQCPSGLPWGTNGGAGLADVGAAKLLDSLKKVYSLDSTRLYVSGLSWGGVGTWGMMESYPNIFAACVPSSGTWQLGGSSPIDGATLIKTPFWASTGTNDATMDGGTGQIVAAVEQAEVSVVRFASSKFMANPTGISVDSLYRAVSDGSLYLWSRVTNGVHADGWLEAYNSPLLVPWMFSKSKVNGKTVFTWPAPATGATAVDSRIVRQNTAKSSSDLRVENGFIRWRGVSQSPVRLDLYSATGRLVISQVNLHEKSHMPCAGLPKGVYFAVITAMRDTPQKEYYRLAL